MEQQDRILGYFLEEANEHLNTIEQGLLKLPETVRQPAMIKELFRAAHSIKGSAAMLGLTDVQQVGNQFESNFKILKERPIAVDDRLRSLFLESFSFLRAAIEEVAKSPDPYRRNPNSPPPVGDPVFGELKSYLQDLLDQATPLPTTANEPQPGSPDPAVEQVFGEYVRSKLGELSSLCLQPDNPEIRIQIQQICQKLGNLGENFEFLEWTNLFTGCRLAIANTRNTLPQLGESITIAVKQAQILVLAGRPQSIGITPDLEALINNQHDLAQSVDRGSSTLKLDDANNFGSTNSATEIILPVNNQLEIQTSPGLSSIYDMPLAQLPELNQEVEFLNLDGSGNFTNSISSPAEFDSELELNDFMNLLSDDIPIEGTWMQDEDLSGDGFIPNNLADLAVTDKFYEQMFEPVSLSDTATPVVGNKNIEIALPQVTIDQEETFYNPDQDDLDIATFWSDEELAVDDQSLYKLDELDLLENSSYQLQPQHPPLHDLDIPAPEFSVDSPISDLFPIGTVTGDWSEIETDLSSIPIESLSLSEQTETSAVPNLNEIGAEADLDHENLDLDTNWTGEEVSFGTDILAATDMSSSLDLDLNSLQTDDWDLNLSDPTQFKADANEKIATDSSSIEWNDFMAEIEFDEADDSVDEYLAEDISIAVTDTQELDPISPQDHASIDSDLPAFTDVVINLTSDALFFEDLDDHELFKAAAIEDTVSAELTDWIDSSSDLPLLGDFSTLSSDAPSDFTNLDFGGFENLAPIVDTPSSNDDFANLDLGGLDELAVVADTSSDDDFTNLDFGGFENLAPIVDTPSSNDDFANLDLGGLDELAVVADTSSDDDFTNLDFGGFENLAPIVDTPSSNDDFANLDLGGLDELAVVADTSSDDDFANLDFGGLDNLTTDPNKLSIPELDNLANLEFSTDLSNHQLTDLENILIENSSATTADFGDLDSLLLGTATIGAMGIGGAILSSNDGGFDDLDALIGNATPDASSDSLDDLDSLLAPPTPVAAKPVAPSPGKTTDRRSKQRTFEQTMRVSVGHLNNLNNLVGELVVNRNTLEQDQNRMRQFIEKLLSEVQKLNEVGKRMQDLYERSLMENSLVASRQAAKPTPNQIPISTDHPDQSGGLMEYDPLEMDRFTPIHLLSQKMIELTVRVRESTADIEFVVDGSTEVTRTLRQITGQLQEDLTKSRMIPFAQTADRLQRGVRENGLKYGKQVALAIDGRDTLIDKVILESLSDPLIHMVNNAIAHGIESPEVRVAAGKPPEGKISIRALHQGNQTIISISDDGAGINTEIVKNKAVQKGIITAQQAATMPKSEIYELLFLPSFSTKDQADELAGRGVGMDVVRTSLTEIRGTITTESQLGSGTTFTIRLPLALSIAKALIAVNNKTNIAFPMDGIEDTQDVSPEQIQTNNLGETCIFWRDELMPFKPLGDLLGFNRPLPRNNFYGAQEDDNDLLSVLILRSDGNLLAVQVDKIVGEQEIVIKPLQGPASKPVGIAGATVLGDGRIIPIADVMELIDLAKGTITRHISTKWTTEMLNPVAERRESMVLIVDDSITVRELLSLTFKRAGYRVEQARDGQEAWDKLRAGLPCDIVFCDIEMPRMDGLEFLSRVQKDLSLSKVPVAMLTSRGSDRHRQIAAQLGASGYFIKPYLEEALLDAAKRMIQGEVLAIV